MNVYAEVLPDRLGHCAHRISRALKNELIRAGHSLVRNREEAEIEVFFIISSQHLNQIIDTGKPYVVFLLDLYFPRHILHQLVRDVPVITHIDLGQMGIEETEYLRTPFGYDPDVFFIEAGREKKYGIVTTGHISETELIEECHLACNRAGYRFAHVGGRVTDLDGDYFENIADAMMRRLYNHSFFVAGTRISNGFEMPVVEGLACGARPICLDLEPYQRWFGEHVRYAQGDVEGLSLAMGQPWPVEETDLDWLRKNFTWKTLTPSWLRFIKEKGVL